MIEPTLPDPRPQERPDGKEPMAADGPRMDFTVRLERVFQGPLDLLLQLVREKELEIHAVSLAQVCDEYCEYVRALEQVDVDEAADYLVLAATLLAIKSRSLLPQEEIEADEDPFEPGEELVQQLLTYKSLREAAEELMQRYEARGLLLTAGGRWRGRVEEDGEEEEPDWDLGEVSLWDLLRVFRRLEEETGFNRPHQLPAVGRPLRDYVEEVWGRLQEMPDTSLVQLARQEGMEAHDVAYYLVALLELAKQRAVDLRQDEPFADVLVQRVPGRTELNLGGLDQAFDDNPAELEPELEDLLGDEKLADMPEAPPAGED